MRWSAKKLRWLMLGGLLLLLVTVAGFFVVARYRAGLVWQRILARNGVHFKQDTNGFTYTQSSKGRNLFTLHASRATPVGKNRWQLHDAVLTLYGRQPGQDDRISGKEFDYDADAGVARALGEVDMDLQTPPPAGSAAQAGAPGQTARQTIHVRTSGLVYMRKLGVAATSEPTEFRYGDVLCTSRGAEFDSAQSTVHLLADVHLEGTLQKAQPYRLNAADALLNRSAQTVTLLMPNLVTGDQRARADHAVLYLRKDGSLDHAEAQGGTELHTATQSVAAPHLQAAFGAADRPLVAHLYDGVRYADTTGSLATQGASQQLDLHWDSLGAMQTARATGAVRLVQSGSSADGAQVSRQLAGQLINATFAGAPGQGAADLRHVVVTGAAEVRNSVQTGTQAPSTFLAQGDELTADLLPAAQLQLQKVHAEGHTRLEQTLPDGAHRVSTGQTLLVLFQPAGAMGHPAEVSSAVQAGGVHLQNWSAPKARAGGGYDAGDLTTATASHAVYTAAANALVLTADDGTRAHVETPGGEVEASSLTLQQSSGDLQASGDVRATSHGAPGGPASHALAARASFLHAADMATFYGTPGHPAELFQAGSQVVADTLTLDGQRHRLTARPASAGQVVHAILVSAREHAPAGHGGTDATQLPQAERGVARVDADQLDYDEAGRVALFAGHVHLSNSLGVVTAQRGAGFLTPAVPGGQARVGASSPASGPMNGLDVGGTLERMVMQGDVVLQQPGRTGRGEQLTYAAAAGTFALTGTASAPPRVTGEQGSVVTGRTLMVRGADSTIVVTGGTAEEHGKPSRVHTELDLKSPAGAR